MKTKCPECAYLFGTHRPGCGQIHRPADEPKGEQQLAYERLTEAIGVDPMFHRVKCSKCDQWTVSDYAVLGETEEDGVYCLDCSDAADDVPADGEVDERTVASASIAWREFYESCDGGEFASKQNCFIEGYNIATARLTADLALAEKREAVLRELYDAVAAHDFRLVGWDGTLQAKFLSAKEMLEGE